MLDQKPTMQVLSEEQELIMRTVADDSVLIPRGMYRAHRSIVGGVCAHCGKRFRRRATIGYNSCLPGRHKVICGECFYGESEAGQ